VRDCNSVVLPDAMAPIMNMRPWASIISHKYAASKGLRVFRARRWVYGNGCSGNFLITKLEPRPLISLDKVSAIR